MRLNSVKSDKTVIDVRCPMAAELVKNIFYNKAPLHDGAVIIRDLRVHMAGCVLPLSDENEALKNLGTRHRAGVGMSEKSDAVVVIVSEETGNISIVKGGKAKSKIDPQKLNNALKQALEEQEESPAN